MIVVVENIWEQIQNHGVLTIASVKLEPNLH